VKRSECEDKAQAIFAIIKGEVAKPAMVGSRWIGWLGGTIILTPQ
jgi:hypothetical protein